LALGCFVSQYVACKSATTLDPAGSGFSEAFGGAAVCFNLWHKLTPSCYLRNYGLINPLFFNFRSNNHIHVATLDTRLILYDCHILQLFCNTLNNRPPNIHVGNLTTSEHQGYLGFIALFQKALDILD